MPRFLTGLRARLVLPSGRGDASRWSSCSPRCRACWTATSRSRTDGDLDAPGADGRGCSSSRELLAYQIRPRRRAAADPRADRPAAPSPTALRDALGHGRRGLRARPRAQRRPGQRHGHDRRRPGAPEHGRYELYVPLARRRRPSRASSASRSRRAASAFADSRHASGPSPAPALRSGWSRSRCPSRSPTAPRRSRRSSASWSWPRSSR